MSVDIMVLFGKCIYIHGQNIWKFFYMLSVTYSNHHIHKREAALCLSVSRHVFFFFFTHLK